MSPDLLLVFGLVLLALSIVLLVVEVFVPSAGIISVVAAICAIAGVGMLWKYETAWGITGMLGVLILGPIAMIWAFTMLPHTPIGRAILGGISDEERESIRDHERDRAMSRLALVGQRGTALTDMRPVGEVEIETEPSEGLEGTPATQTIEAYAEHDWIEAGEPVIVTSAQGLEIKVRKA